MSEYLTTNEKLAETVKAIGKVAIAAYRKEWALPDNVTMIELQDAERALAALEQPSSGHTDHIGCGFHDVAEFYRDKPESLPAEVEQVFTEARNRLLRHVTVIHVSDALCVVDYLHQRLSALMPQPISMPPLAAFDECECGDYRHQHSKGLFGCIMPDDACHGCKPCKEFRLSQKATEFPSWVTKSAQPASVTAEKRRQEVIDWCKHEFPCADDEAQMAEIADSLLKAFPSLRSEPELPSVEDIRDQLTGSWVEPTQNGTHLKLTVQDATRIAADLQWWFGDWLASRGLQSRKGLTREQIREAAEVALLGYLQDDEWDTTEVAGAVADAVLALQGKVK